MICTNNHVSHGVQSLLQNRISHVRRLLTLAHPTIIQHVHLRANLQCNRKTSFGIVPTSFLSCQVHSNQVPVLSPCFCASKRNGDPSRTTFDDVQSSKSYLACKLSSPTPSSSVLNRSRCAVKIVHCKEQKKDSENKVTIICKSEKRIVTY